MDGHESDSGDEEQRREAMCVAASLLIVDSATQTEQEEAEFENLHKRLASDAMLAAETAVEGHGESDDLFGIGSPFGMARYGVEERIRGSLMGTCVREAGKLLPGPGRGRSEANAATSNMRRNLRYPDGIYGRGARRLRALSNATRDSGATSSTTSTQRRAETKGISSEFQGTSTGSSRQLRTVRDVGSRERSATATGSCVGS
ncbi:unnamed protein product [Ectocarpus fasciculatus]